MRLAPLLVLLVPLAALVQESTFHVGVQRPDGERSWGPRSGSGSACGVVLVWTRFSTLNPR